MSRITSTTRPPDDELETLIGRIVDREASDAEYERFEAVASVDSSLWRALAQRQIDMGLLADRVGAEAESADAVEAAVPATAGGARFRGLALLLSGWAAVVALGAWWAVTAAGRDGPERGGALQAVTGAAGPELSPDEHLQRYLEAPFVLGEMDPILLETVPREDGTWLLRVLRRIEMEIEVDSLPEGLRDADGPPAIDPSVLRRGAATGRRQG